jgi:hypothetical protein
VNLNTVAAFVGGTAVGQIASQTLASTTETEFKYNTGASPTTAIAVLAPPISTGIYGSRAPFDPSVNQAQPVRTGTKVGSQNFNSTFLSAGQPFLVRVCGVATPASNAGNTLAIILYLGATKSGTAICTTGAVNQASTTTARPFIVEAELIWDSTSQTVFGQFWWKLEGTSSTDYATWAELSANGSSVTAAALQFCASATWGNSAGGVTQVSEFSISRL